MSGNFVGQTVNVGKFLESFVDRKFFFDFFQSDEFQFAGQADFHCGLFVVAV